MRFCLPQPSHGSRTTRAPSVFGDLDGAVGGAGIDEHDFVGDLLRGADHVADQPLLVLGADVGGDGRLVVAASFTGVL